MRRHLLTLAFMLASCAPSHLTQQRLVTEGCGALLVVQEGDPSIWLLSDVERVCERVQESVGLDARALLWSASVSVHYRYNVTEECHGDDACTAWDRPTPRYTIYIPTYPGAPRRELLAHEVAHVIAWQAGIEAKDHHPWMAKHGLCAGACYE